MIFAPLRLPEKLGAASACPPRGAYFPFCLWPLARFAFDWDGREATGARCGETPAESGFGERQVLQRGRAAESEPALLAGAGAEVEEFLEAAPAERATRTAHGIRVVDWTAAAWREQIHEWERARIQRRQAAARLDES